MKIKYLTIFVCFLIIFVTSLVVTGQTIQIKQQKRLLLTDITRTDKDCEIPLSHQFCNDYELSIDVEKHVLDLYSYWVDADTEKEAVDLPICKDAKFKIILHNGGEESLYNIVVKDKMNDSLKFISGDPEPDEVYYEEPFWYMEWYIPVPLHPSEIIEIYITTHVEGPKCIYVYNHVKADGDGYSQNVTDEDYAYVHIGWCGRLINRPVLLFLQSHPFLFPLLQKLIRQLEYKL